LSQNDYYQRAGGETTAVSLNHLVYLLLSNPSALHKLQQELDSTFPSGSDDDQTLDLETLCHLPYLNACIKEALRIYPPVSNSYRTVSEGGISIDGDYIPAGVDVVVPFCLFTHDPRNFSSPDEFRPERYLNPQEESHFHATYSSFAGTGMFGCVGRNLALDEIRCVVGSLFRSWNVELIELEGGRKWEIFNTPGRFVLGNRKYTVKVTKRV
jgi:cytochrome P450